MKKIIYSSILFIVYQASAMQSVHLQGVGAKEHAKMHILVGLINPSHDLKKMAGVLQKDLAFTDQFTASIHTVNPLQKQDDVVAWYKQGYPLALFLEEGEGHTSITWRLYDAQAARMVQGKKMLKKGTESQGWAHNLADEIWPVITGNQGFFSSKLVYGKEICRRGRNCKRAIAVRDAVDDIGITEQILVATPTINVAPRWNRDSNNPMVLFSQYRPANVALVAADLHKKIRVVSNFDGVNMQVAYSPDSTEVVYCLSRCPRSNMQNHITSQLYYYTVEGKTKKEVFKRITHNNGNNFAPCWGPGHTLFYASDATKNGQPNICWLNLDTAEVTWITQDSYATSPNYSPVTNRLIYTKMVDKKMQLCMYDFSNQSHLQLTFDDTNKDDCSWSPCGNLIAYSSDRDGKSRICMYNTLTKQTKWISPEGDDCSYPSWSPIFPQYQLVS